MAKRFIENVFQWFLLILASATFLHAQSERPSCPSISVEGPNRTSRPGEKVPYKVIISKGYDTSNLRYSWSVSNGNVIQGQGTTSISIEHGKDSYTVTVEIIGLPENCIRTASESTSYDPPPSPAMIADYWKISFSEEKIKLDEFNKALQNDPYSTGHFRKVFPRGFSKSAAYRNLRQVLNRLKFHGIDENRVTFGLAFGEKEFTQIFIVPAGAKSPFEIGDEILKAAQLSYKLKPAAAKSRKTPPRTN